MSDIEGERKALRDKAAALKSLYEIGDLSYDEYAREIAQIKKRRRLLRQSNQETPNLPAVITHGTSKEYPRKPGRDDRNCSVIAENASAHDERLAKDPERRCIATNSKGERCRRFAILGSNVCKTHGGATRHTINKARVRLEMAAVPLVGKLTEIAMDDTKPAAVQLDAIKDSLNRIGVNKPAQVEVGPLRPFETVFDDIVSQRPGSEPMNIDETNHVHYQHDSNADTPRPGCDNQEPKPRNYYETPPVTGDDAIRLANQANGLIPGQRALPRPQSRHRN